MTSTTSTKHSRKYPAGMNASDFRDILPQLAAFYAPDMLYELDDLMRLEDLLIYNDINVEQAGLRLTSTCEETLIRYETFFKFRPLSFRY